jgi:hypothetical protein
MIAYMQSSVLTDRVDLHLADGANVTLRICYVPVGQANTATLTHEFDSVAGATTFKARVARAIGTGTVSVGANTVSTSFICIDDIGPSGAPA